MKLMELYKDKITWLQNWYVLRAQVSWWFEYRDDSHISKALIKRKEDTAGDLLLRIQHGQIQSLHQIYDIYKGICYTDKGIRSDGAFKTEHEHLVPVFSLFVLHDRVFGI